MIEPSDAWEPRAQLLQAAHGAGFELSDPQLGRLHRAGLVPRPRTRRLGRGKGTTSDFPPGSTDRLLSVLQIQKREHTRKLSTVAWRLWWEDGGSLAPPGRKLLAKLADDWDRARNDLLDLLTREDAGEHDAERQIDAIYLEAELGRLPAPIATARRNAGRAGFSSITRVFMEIAAGRFESYQDHEEPAQDGTPRPGTIGALVEKALGLDHGRKDRIAGNEPRFTGSSEEDLARLSKLVGKREFGPLALAPDDALNQARIEAQNFVLLFSKFAPLLEGALGGDPGGYKTIRRVLNPRTPRIQAFLLLAWLAFRDDDQLLEGMQELLALLPKILAMTGIKQRSDELVRVVPALAPALASAERAHVRGDTNQAAKSLDEIKRISNQHRTQVDSFFEQHPDIKTLIATIENSE